MTNGCGANSLWLTEWLSSEMELKPGMRVLDLGCGKGMSSIFLAREFDVQVWATDLWTDATGNLQRVRDADIEDRVFPIHADARSLPFAGGLFDAIVCVDAFSYFGTDALYLRRELPKQAAREGRNLQVHEQLDVLVCVSDALGDRHRWRVMGWAGRGGIQPRLHLGALFLHGTTRYEAHLWFVMHVGFLGNLALQPQHEQPNRNRWRAFADSPTRRHPSGHIDPE